MPQPSQSADNIFRHALALSSLDERNAYLDSVLNDTPDIREEVQSLLAAHEQSSVPAGLPAMSLPGTGPYQSSGPPATIITATQVSPQGTTDPGARIGPYLLIKKLGEGGMGTVYLAEQEEPIRRQVALKVVKAGMDSEQVVARFKAERQALTRMEHPNIARVFDAGTTVAGLPYFVMELVAGEPLSQYCDRNTLTLRERVALLVTVCQAVQHAHQKGIIHRDLKSGNVLVTVQDGVPVAKVIDFGLAKATEMPLSDEAMLTHQGTVVGTLEYMSPEQADFSGAGVDTRTDVYSLGVMLYELLTGTTPLDRAGGSRAEGMLEMLRRIREEEPPRPSVRVAHLGDRLTRIAERRKVEPNRLPGLLRGELDWITLKALEKDRDRRYESASGLARDLQRYLDDEPVEACPPSTRYRLFKFARKYRYSLATAAGFLLMLILGVVGLAIGLVVVDRERGRAVAAQKWSKKALDQTDVAMRTLVGASPTLGEEERAILLVLLQEFQALADELDTEDKGPVPDWQRKALAAEAKFRVASYATLLQKHETAESAYRRTLELYGELAAHFPEDAVFRDALGRVHYDLGLQLQRLRKFAAAEVEYHQAMELFSKLVEDHPDGLAYRHSLARTLNNLGTVLFDQRKWLQAEKVLLRAVELGEQTARELPADQAVQIKLAGRYHNLGNVVRDQGKAEKSLAWYDKAIEILEPMLQAKQAKVPAQAIEYCHNTHWDRANALGQLGRHAEATRDWQRTMQLHQGGLRDRLAVFLQASRMEETLAESGQRTGGQLYAAARLNGQAAGAAMVVEEPSLNERYARRALELLKQARSGGYFREKGRVEEVKADRSFASLKDRPEFRAFLDELAKGNIKAPTQKGPGLR